MKIKLNNLIKFIIGLIILLSFVYITSKMINPDLGWHLRIGEWIFNNKSVPYFDQYSYTMPGFRWVDHEWLIDAWLWWMHFNNLWWLVILVFSIVAFLPFFIWLKRCKSLINLWIIILVAGLILNFIGIKPQIISFFFFFLVFDILYKNKKFYLLILPIIFFIWANLHAGFFSGLTLFGLFVAINLLLDWQKTKRLTKAISKNYLALSVLLISLAVTLVNPYGWELYKEIFTVMLSSDTAKYISEWRPALGYFNLNFLLLIAIIISLFIKYYKKYPLQIFIPGLLFLILYLKSIRMGLLFFVIAIPLATLGFKFLQDEISISQKEKPFTKKQLKSFKIIGASLFVFIFGLLAYTLATYESFKLPEKAVVFLKERIKQERIENILNDYGWGGYLIWRVPAIKVFVDGRMPYWLDKNGNSAMKDYIKIFYSNDENALKEIFKKYKIITVIIKNKSEPDRTSKLLNLVPFKIKNNLSKSWLVRQINHFFSKKKPINLKEFLLKNNWEIIYQDEIAVIIKCYSRPCFVF